MSGYQNARAISLACAAASIAANRFVAMSATGITYAAAGGNAVGMTLEAYDHTAYGLGNASNVIAVAQLDGSKLMIEAGAAIAAGAAVASDATGRAVTAAGTGTAVLGYAVPAAGAAGEIIQIVAARGNDIPA